MEEPCIKFRRYKWEHTDWLSLQEVNVVKHLPLSGSQIVQPVLDDALALLETTRKHLEPLWYDPQDDRRINKSCIMFRTTFSPDLWGEEAELALNVLVDVVLLAGEATHAAAKLRLDGLVHAHLLGSSQQAEGDEKWEEMSSRIKPVCRGCPGCRCSAD